MNMSKSATRRMTIISKGRPYLSIGYWDQERGKGGVFPRKKLCRFIGECSDVNINTLQEIVTFGMAFGSREKQEKAPI